MCACLLATHILHTTNIIKPAPTSSMMDIQDSEFYYPDRNIVLAVNHDSNQVLFCIHKPSWHTSHPPSTPCSTFPLPTTCSMMVLWLSRCMMTLRIWDVSFSSCMIHCTSSQSFQISLHSPNEHIWCRSMPSTPFTYEADTLKVLDCQFHMMLKYGADGLYERLLSVIQVDWPLNLVDWDRVCEDITTRCSDPRPVIALMCAHGQHAHLGSLCYYLYCIHYDLQLGSGKDRSAAVEGGDGPGAMEQYWGVLFNHLPFEDHVDLASCIVNIADGCILWSTPIHFQSNHIPQTYNKAYWCQWDVHPMQVATCRHVQGNEVFHLWIIGSNVSINGDRSYVGIITRSIYLCLL